MLEYPVYAVASQADDGTYGYEWRSAYCNGGSADGQAPGTDCRESDTAGSSSSCNGTTGLNRFGLRIGCANG